MKKIILISIFSFLLLLIFFWLSPLTSKNFISALNKNSGAIQGITVVVLIGVTWWYAYTTKTMSEIMLSEFQLKKTPYLAIDRTLNWNYDITTGPKYDNIQIVFTLLNVGQTPLMFNCEEVEIGGISFPQDKIACLLFPNQNIDFSSGFKKLPILSGLKKPEDIILNDISAKFVFWSNENPNKKYFISRKSNLFQNRFFIQEDNYGIMDT